SFPKVQELVEIYDRQKLSANIDYPQHECGGAWYRRQISQGIDFAYVGRLECVSLLPQHELDDVKALSFARPLRFTRQQPGSLHQHSPRLLVSELKAPLERGPPRFDSVMCFLQVGRQRL